VRPHYGDLSPVLIVGNVFDGMGDRRRRTGAPISRTALTELDHNRRF
jgi:hypothetical protein